MMPVLCMIHRILLILGAVRFSANERHQIFVLLKELLLRMTKRILLSIKNFPYHGRKWGWEPSIATSNWTD